MIGDINDLYQLARHGSADDLKNLLEQCSFSYNQTEKAFALCIQNGCVGGLETIEVLWKHITMPTSKKNAFLAAAQYGNFDVVRLIMKDFDTSDVNHEALKYAAMDGHLECVKAIVVACHDKEHINTACWYAIDSEYMDIVRLLLPHIDAKLEGSILLRRIVHYKKEAAFDMVYPLSDPYVALKELQKEGATKNIGTLTARIKADEEHKILHEQLNNHTNASKTSKKM